jgi:tRNA G18 (ribose-2'-O)-methylase SpoU
MANSSLPDLRGFFGIGVERLSKPVNAGNLFRSAHAFGASFVYTIDAKKTRKPLYSDTSNTIQSLPFYEWAKVEDAAFPEGCQVVGIELIDGAVDLPSFKHPLNCAYLLGPEDGSLSDAAVKRCDQIVRIPAKFCVNVAIAGAVVMYDRIRVLGRFPDRPLSSQQIPTARADHVWGHSANDDQDAK